MATKITDHFTYEEMTTTQQRHLDNTPGEEEKIDLERLCLEILEPLREVLGPIHINSGFRSLAVNTAIGGSKTSQHMKGQAADIVPVKQKSLKVSFEAILESGIEFDQLIFEKFGGPGWIHVSIAPRGKKPRRQALMVGTFTKGKYLPYDCHSLSFA